MINSFCLHRFLATLLTGCLLLLQADPIASASSSECDTQFKKLKLSSFSRFRRTPITDYSAFQKLYQSSVADTLPEALRAKIAALGTSVSPSFSQEEMDLFANTLRARQNALMAEITKYGLTAVDMKTLRRRADFPAGALDGGMGDFARLSPLEQKKLLEKPMADYFMDFLFNSKERLIVSERTDAYIKNKGYLPKIYQGKWLLDKIKSNPILATGMVATLVLGPAIKQLKQLYNGFTNSYELVGDQHAAALNTQIFGELAAKMYDPAQKAVARQELAKALGRDLTDAEFKEIFDRQVKRMTESHFMESAQNIPAFVQGREVYAEYIATLSDFIFSVYIAQGHLNTVAIQTAALEQDGKEKNKALLETLANQKTQNFRYMESFRDQLATMILARAYMMKSAGSDPSEPKILRQALDLLTDPINKDLDPAALWEIYYAAARAKH